MTCKECGAGNRDDALFCAHCGAKVENSVLVAHGRECSECGFGNPHEGRFCARCGAELRRHQNGHFDQHHQGQQSQQKHQKKKGRRVDTKLKWHPGLVAVALLIGVVAFIAGMELFVKEQPSLPPQFVETKSTDAKLEATVMEISSKFICSCGTCGEKPLDICTCNRAVEERQFIRNYVEQGQKPAQVILALSNTYGWIKPEFAALVGDSASTTVAVVKKNLTKAQAESRLPVDTFSAAGGPAQLATPADRMNIFSQFKCSCGQCGVDELKDCACQHPKGATEVKAFVDARIAEGKYTVVQLLDIVDAKYGGRKF